MKKNTWLKWAILASSTALFVGFLQLTNDVPQSDTTVDGTTLLPETPTAPSIAPPSTDEQDELYDDDDDDDDFTEEEEEEDDDFRPDRRSFSSTLNREAQPSNGYSQSSRS